jgi:hypothetical protein
MNSVDFGDPFASHRDHHPVDVKVLLRSVMLMRRKQEEVEGKSLVKRKRGKGMGWTLYVRTRCEVGKVVDGQVLAPAKVSMMTMVP